MLQEMRAENDPGVIEIFAWEKNAWLNISDVIFIVNVIKIFS